MLFVLTRFLNIDILQQSNASIFTPLSYLLWRLSYRSYRIFLKKTWAFLGFAKNNFWVFLSVPHLVDNYAKIVDGRGRNLMCHRTLPSRLVCFCNSKSFLQLYIVLLWISISPLITSPIISTFKIAKEVSCLFYCAVLWLQNVIENIHILDKGASDVSTDESDYDDDVVSRVCLYLPLTSNLSSFTNVKFFVSLICGKKWL